MPDERTPALLQTEFEFTLPCGFVDEHGDVHRVGVMRRATALDEIEPQRDQRVTRNEAYLAVILLSRVLTRLGRVAQVTPKVIESLFATDLAFLQRLYSRINALDEEGEEITCPACQHRFGRAANGVGE